MPDHLSPCHLTLAEREAYEERAAIMEYDGGLPRADAEREAMREIALARIRSANRPATPTTQR